LGDRWFFLFGFGKNERANIDARELAALQSVAEALLSLNVEQIDQAIQARELEEIESEEKSAASGNA